MNSFACSLLIPCRNAARFLPGLFEGVHAQRLPFSEIVLWDDGSTDDSAAIAAHHGARVLRTEQSAGPATARNQLVKAARCEWVHLHDADDLISPDYLAIMAEHARDVDVVACDADWINADSGEVCIRWRYQQSEFDSAPTEYLLTHPLGINNCIYQRGAFLLSGGYDPSVVPWEDADFHTRLAFAERRFTFVPQVLTKSRRHAGGISMNYIRNWESRLRCLRNYASNFPPRFRPTIAAEAERAASELLALRSDAAREAIALCCELGGDPPTTQNALLIAWKKIFGRITAMKLQAIARGRYFAR